MLNQAAQAYAFGSLPRGVRITASGRCVRRPQNMRYLEEATSRQQRKRCTSTPERPQDTRAPFAAAGMCSKNRLKTSISLCFAPCRPHPSCPFCTPPRINWLSSTALQPRPDEPRMMAGDPQNGVAHVPGRLLCAVSGRIELPSHPLCLRVC